MAQEAPASSLPQPASSQTAQERVPAFWQQCAALREEMAASRRSGSVWEERLATCTPAAQGRVLTPKTSDVGTVIDLCKALYFTHDPRAVAAPSVVAARGPRMYSATPRGTSVTDRLRWGLLGVGASPQAACTAGGLTVPPALERSATLPVCFLKLIPDTYLVFAAADLLLHTAGPRASSRPWCPHAWTRP